MGDVTTTQDSDDRPRDLRSFLDALDAMHVWYTLGRPRDSIMVTVLVPGTIWEVEFMDDGSIEVEKFVSTDGIGGPEWIDDLLASARDD